MHLNVKDNEENIGDLYYEITKHYFIIMCIVQHGYYPMQILFISAYLRTIAAFDLSVKKRSFKLVGSLSSVDTQLHDLSPAAEQAYFGTDTCETDHVKQDSHAFLRINTYKRKWARVGV